MKQSLKYSLQVWLSSAFLAPLVLGLLDMFLGNKKPAPTFGDIFTPYYFMGVLIYLFITVLPWVVMFVIVGWLPSFGLSNWVNKLIALVTIEVLLGIIPMLGTWSNPKDSATGVISWLSFAIPTAIFVFVYRLTPQTTPAQTTAAGE